MSGLTEVKRDVVKLGIDLRPLPVDVGDGIEWLFTSDPSPDQWTSLMSSLKVFTKMKDISDADIDNAAFTEALAGFSKAMAAMLVDEEQQKQWIARGYGLGPQQALSELLMETWSGFPTKPSSDSGKESKTTG